MEFTGTITTSTSAYPSFHQFDQSKLFHSDIPSPPPYPTLLSTTQAQAHCHTSVQSHHSSGCLHSDPSSPSPIIQPAVTGAFIHQHHQSQHLAGNAYEVSSEEDLPRWDTSPRSPFSSDSSIHLHQLPASALLPSAVTSSPGIMSYEYSYPASLYHHPNPTAASYNPHSLPPPTPPAPAPPNVLPGSSSSSNVSWGTSHATHPSSIASAPISHPDPRSRSWSPDSYERASNIHHLELKRPRTDPDLFNYAGPALSTSEPFLLRYEGSYPATSLSKHRSPGTSRRLVQTQFDSPALITSSKKKKREVREATATCGRCGRMMGRLTLRGSAEEMVVSGGYEIIQTCRECQGMGSTAVTGGVERQVHIPFGGCTTFTVQIPTSTTMRKRNRRTDDVTAPTTCDCCGRQLGVGGIVARNGRSAVQFAVEVVCVGCVERYRRCTDCGGGGGSRLGVGKWRCKELFSDGRRTCVLSHQRQGGNGVGETRNVVWSVGKIDLDEVIEQVKELVKHSLYAALATPEMLESGVARVTKFDDINTMYLNGWKRIESMMKQDAEASEGRKRYVGLRWSKPHPRKGPKRQTLPTPVNEELKKRTLIEPGKELTGFVLAEWDMEKGTMFIAVAMPWQSGDALESTSCLSHETLLLARADRAELIQRLVGSGQMTHEEAVERLPPIEHLWTTLFFERDSRLIQFIEKRKQFKRLSEYLATNRDVRVEDFRQSFLTEQELATGIWETWVRREPSTKKSSK